MLEKRQVNELGENQKHEYVPFQGFCPVQATDTDSLCIPCPVGTDATAYSGGLEKWVSARP